MSARARQALVWLGFGVLLLLATAPVWGALVYGVDPTLDQALLFICGGR
jgi:hypothetical protein